MNERSFYLFQILCELATLSENMAENHLSVFLRGAGALSGGPSDGGAMKVFDRHPEQRRRRVIEKRREEERNQWSLSTLALDK